jgi:DNA-binding NarL/FixJ family response regulator
MALGLCEGRDRQQIAEALGINEKTVNTYRTRLLQKLDARNSVDLLWFAADEGLLSDSE